MRSSLSIWLTMVILATIVAFLTVFRPITFAARKDPSDPSRYLRPVGAAADFTPTRPPSQPTASLFGKTKMYIYVPQHDLRLGLDLRGGMRVVLQIPNRAEYVYKLTPALDSMSAASQKQGELATLLKGEDVLGPNAEFDVMVVEHEARITTSMNSAEDAEFMLPKITVAVETTFGKDKFNAPKAEDVFLQANEQMQQSVLSIMEKRLNATGLTEVTAYAKGDNQVVLEIPGVKDPKRVEDILISTGEMEFRMIPDTLSVSVDDKDGTVRVSRTGSGEEVSQEDAINMSYLVMTGRALRPDCGVTYDQQKEPAVSFSMNSQEDREKFAAVTAGNIDRQLAIVLEGKIVTAPVIRDRIYGEGIISGSFTMDEAKDMAVLLNAGALPVPVDIVENRTVSATLGADSVAASLQAGIFGLLAVLVFMFAYYRLPGLMANFALIIYVFFTLAVLWLFQATLTLPGIAGIIISIGMAVDANVIIFERLKEELRTQKPLATAIDVAFSRAWTAILDSNVASLITGFVLYSLGTGAVRGFAITLMIGVAVSMFTAITVTRMLMRLMIRSKAGQNMAWYGV